MKLIIISGRSGSGKSTALRALEDAGFSCIDNFPVELLSSLVSNTLADSTRSEVSYAVCVDARSRNLDTFPEFYASIDPALVDCEVIFLDALTGTLVKRFSETRRRHPLTDDSTDLLQAIESEKGLLANISNLADLVLDTTLMRGSELVEVVRKQIAVERNRGIPASRSCSGRSVTSSACRWTRIWFSISAVCPIPTGSRHCGPCPGWTSR
jgi:UPF0042 nucleotide-binding protein